MANKRIDQLTVTTDPGSDAVIPVVRAGQTTAEKVALANLPVQDAIHPPPILGRKWVFLGDSLTAGTGASAGQDYPTMLKYEVGTTNISYTHSSNAGVGGNTSANVLARTAAAISGYEGLVLLVGTNDAGQGVPLTTYSANVQAIVDLAQRAGIKVIIGTVPPRTAAVATTDTKQLTDQYNLWIKTWAPTAGVRVADLWTALVDTSDGNLAAAYAYSDGVHLSRTGYWVVAQTFATVAKTLVNTVPFITAPSTYNAVTNPLMAGGATTPTGYYNQGGTGTAPTRSMPADSSGKLQAGRWWELDFTATSGGTQSVGFDTSGILSFSVGDHIGLFGQVQVEDVSGWATHSLDGTANVKLQVMKQNAVGIDYAITACPSLNPGPLAQEIVVPSGTTGILVWFTVTLPTGDHVKFRVGALGVVNLTTLGIAL